MGVTCTFDAGTNEVNVDGRIMYRLYHKVEVSTRFTHRGPQAQGCVNCIETNTE